MPFLRPLWGGLNTRTRPTRAAYTRARVVRGASEPTTNIACRAYSCTARRRCSPTKATKWREASRAVREARFASHDCRGPTPPQPRNTSRAMHANAVAPQRAHPAFRAAASVPSSSRRAAAPDERVGTMCLSGSPAPTPRTGTAVGRIELREAQSAPRQRKPSAVHTVKSGVARATRHSFRTYNLTPPTHAHKWAPTCDPRGLWTRGRILLVACSVHM